jgi:hypothetical protein
MQLSDYNTVRTALLAKVTDELVPALQAKAPGLKVVTIGTPSFTVTSDHGIGDATETFNLTIAGTVEGTSFSESDARGLVGAALQRQVPGGYQLTADPIETDFQVAAVTSSGGVTIVGTASAFTAQKVESEKLSKQLSGMRVDEARNLLQRAIPGGRVDIQLQPFALPWLPMVDKQIHMLVVVASAPQA